MKVKIKRLNDLAVMPLRGSEQAAGYDLYLASSYDIEIPPHETVMLGTGLAMEIPEGYFGAIFARSGIAAKRGLRPANAVGVIDADFRSEVKVALHNDTNYTQVVAAHERIAQLVIMPFLAVEFAEEELSETNRGEGGFGSTGAK